MPQSRSSSASDIIADLAKTPRIGDLGPFAARFVYSLRLIALYERARRDPVSELAMRLGSVDSAAKTLALAHAISGAWPENIHVSRFCCELMSHDEATIGNLLEAATVCSGERFDTSISGLV